MKKLLVSTFVVAVVALAELLAGSAAYAQISTDAFSISFVDCDDCIAMGYSCTDPRCTIIVQNTLNPSDVAGFFASANWNNAYTMGGVLPNLVRDINGVAVTTSAAVLWESTNTFSSTGRGEENNNFIGADRTLMIGYLDQNTLTPSPTFVQIRNIPDDMAVNYDVVIYTLGGTPNRGGEYTVNGGTPKYVVASGDGTFNGPDYHEAIGDDPSFGTNDWGNYVVFQGLSGNTVTITATNTFGAVPRAPINGVQIVNRQP